MTSDLNAIQTNRLNEVAGSLDCLTEDDFMLLAGITAGTAEAWRKRGKGPSYILVGKRYLYPRAAMREFLATLVRERKAVRVKDLL